MKKSELWLICMLVVMAPRMDDTEHFVLTLVFSIFGILNLIIEYYKDKNA
jgi:hypothetical protein